jgi:hypothetical protein
VLLVIIDEVAVIPFTFTVSTFPIAESVRELIILATRLDTPFTIDWNVFVVVLTTLELTRLNDVEDEIPFTWDVSVAWFVEVETVSACELIVGKTEVVVTPFTTDVSVFEFVEVETESEWVVLDTRLAREVVAIEPLIVDVSVVPTSVSVAVDTESDVEVE